MPLNRGIIHHLCFSLLIILLTISSLRAASPPEDGNDWAIVDLSGAGDYTDIASALAAQEQYIYIRDGVYKISTSLKISLENAQFMGESKQGVVIETVEGICADMVHIDADGVTVSDITVKQTPSCPWTAIVSGGRSNVTVKDTIVYGSDTMFAIFFAGPEHAMGQEPIDLVESNQLDENNRVLDNEIYSNATGDVLSFSLQKNGVVSGNTLHGGLIAVFLDRDVVIENNTIFNANSHGIFLSLPSHNVLIRNNIIKDSASSGIKVARQVDHYDENGDTLTTPDHRSRDIYIIGNTIENARLNALEINNLVDSAVTHNTIIAPDFSGIYAYLSERLYIGHNTIIDAAMVAAGRRTTEFAWSTNWDSGIYFDQYVADSTISNNTIKADGHDVQWGIAINPHWPGNTGNSIRWNQLLGEYTQAGVHAGADGNNEATDNVTHADSGNTIRLEVGLGQGKLSHAGTECSGACVISSDTAQLQTFTAEPANGFHFTAWLSPAACAGSTSTQCQAMNTEPLNVVALFSEIDVLPCSLVLSSDASVIDNCTPPDETAPVVTAPAALTVEANGLLTTVNIGMATVMDNVDTSLVATPDLSGPFALGNHVIRWTAQDSAGNEGTATQTVTVVDTTAPEIVAPETLNVSATSALTPVNISDATATDLVDTTVTITSDALDRYSVGTHTITWTAIDASGNQSTATQQLIVQDLTSPVISVSQSTLRINASGVTTPIANYGVTATDAVDGSVNVTAYRLIDGREEALPTDGLVSGVHQLLWKASDQAGNQSVREQRIEIKPLVNFSGGQAVGAGDRVNVAVNLSGNAIQYPVEIPYVIAADESTVAMDGKDHNAVAGVVVMTSGTTGSFSFDIAENPILDGPNGVGTGDLVFALGSLENLVRGATDTHEVTISANNLAPLVTLAMTQNSLPVTQLASAGGVAKITAAATDNSAQTLSFDWSASDAALIDLVSDADAATFEIDPTSVAAGTYTIAVVVRDNGSPLRETTISTAFNVLARTDVLVDSDGDGIDDTNDKVSEPNRLPEVDGADTRYILESEPGTTLKLGDVAIQQGKSSAGIDLAGLTPLPDAYTLNDARVYDFKISGVAIAASSLIAIPQHAPIPANATYLKFDGVSWRPFVEDANNALYSAPGTAGICPGTGDASYTAGLMEGDFCIQLKIQDGGPNDTDKMANGEVADPGAIVAPQSDSAQSNAVASSGGGLFALLLLPLLLLLRLLSASGKEALYKQNAQSNRGSDTKCKQYCPDAHHTA